MMGCMAVNPCERPTAEQLLAALGRLRRRSSLGSSGAEWGTVLAAAPAGALCRRASLGAPI